MRRSTLAELPLSPRLGMCMEPAPEPRMQSMALPIPLTWLSSPPGGKLRTSGRPLGWDGAKGRPCPCAQAWPKPWVVPSSCGTGLWHCPASQGRPCSLSCLFALGGCLQRAGAAPLGALGAEEIGQCRYCPSTGVSILLLENWAPLHPVRGMQGLQILSLLQRTKIKGMRMRS